MSQPKLILIADDEPWLVEALAVTLESRGFVCITAGDMSGAVAALKQHSVSVLVTDIMMPGGPSFEKVESSEAGFRLIEFVQRSWPTLPIVCLSVIGDQQKIDALTDRGVRYLRKGETPLATAVDIISDVAIGRRMRF